MIGPKLPPGPENATLPARSKAFGVLVPGIGSMKVRWNLIEDNRVPVYEELHVVVGKQRIDIARLFDDPQILSVYFAIANYFAEASGTEEQIFEQVKKIIDEASLSDEAQRVTVPDGYRSYE